MSKRSHINEVSEKIYKELELLDKEMTEVIKVNGKVYEFSSLFKKWQDLNLILEALYNLKGYDYK